MAQNTSTFLEELEMDLACDGDYSTLHPESIDQGVTVERAKELYINQQSAFEFHKAIVNSPLNKAEQGDLPF